MQKVAHKFEGKVFERLTVIKRLENHITKNGVVFSKWLCRCICGNEISVIGIDLKVGKTRSCGCLFRETTQQKGLNNRVHGGYSQNSSVDYQIKYRTLCSIKSRAKSRGYVSDLEVDDLPELTDRCPVTGILYEKLKGKISFNTPSIDRKNSNLPYLKKYKDNLAFISYGVNRTKSNFPVDYFQKIVDYMNGRGTGNSEKSSLIDSKPIEISAGNEAQASNCSVND